MKIRWVRLTGRSADHPGEFSGIHTGFILDIAYIRLFVYIIKDVPDTAG